MFMYEELARLTPQQKTVLSEFREQVQDVLTSEHDDEFLLRFLRARDFDKEKAGMMLRKNLIWRKEIGADSVLTDYKVPEAFWKLMPTSFLGLDKDGRSIRYYYLGQTDFKAMIAAVSKFDLLKSSISLYEHDLEQMRINNEKTGKRADTFIIIQDWKDLAITQFASKSVVEYMKEAIRAFDLNYPERVHQMLIIRAPAVFSIVYNIFKGLLSESSRRKIRFLEKDDWREKLAEVVNPDLFPEHLKQEQIDVSNKRSASAP